MGMKHIKYAFNSQSEWDNLKLDISHEVETDEDGNEFIFFNGGDTIAELGNIVLSQDGEDVVYSDTWHVDILWLEEDNEPESFKEFALVLDNIGIHVFAGFNYLNQ
ncbi:MAG: hypothetical protein Unbinned2072contig1001_35 [Prokaryotic dsDNA virus sp.]|nr:MAG: hypothetical protein Unbinned2072contig1001_35 [Prokaryotic dsDNA virus sp.]|tara:strand:- start:23001 stop:23318 length:318 start_codon:yes stop_codon:yes gene_type:complete